MMMNINQSQRRRQFIIVIQSVLQLINLESLIIEYLTISSDQLPNEMHDAQLSVRRGNLIHAGGRTSGGSAVVESFLVFRLDAEPMRCLYGYDIFVNLLHSMCAQSARESQKYEMGKTRKRKENGEQMKYLSKW